LAVTTDDILFSNSHPITGTSVTITAGEETVTSSLAFGVTQTVSISWTAEGGLHDIYVVVDAEETVDETDETNNLVSRRIGEVPPPRLLSAVTELKEGTIGLSWVAPDTTDITGYWIYRAQQ
jgi:hypothetical protein